LKTLDDEIQQESSKLSKMIQQILSIDSRLKELNYKKNKRGKGMSTQNSRREIL
jgi:hypothetical protein